MLPKMMQFPDPCRHCAHSFHINPSFFRATYVHAMFASSDLQDSSCFRVIEIKVEFGQPINRWFGQILGSNSESVESKLNRFTKKQEILYLN